MAKEKTVKGIINAAHRMGRIEGSVRAGDVLSDEQCLQYLKDAAETEMTIDPLVAQEMHRGVMRSKKVLKQLSKFYKNHTDGQK